MKKLGLIVLMLFISASMAFTFGGSPDPPPDTTPPTVSITSPANGATVSGTITISVSASDADSGMNYVDLYINGSYVSRKSSTPYSWSWNTTTVANGSRTIQATAVDKAGNSRSVQISVNVQNTVADTTPPTVSITAPASGATVTGTVTFSASASDSQSGVKEVRFFAGGNHLGTRTSSPYSVNWNTSGYSGTVALQAVAYDNAGNSASASRNVTVQAPGPSPSTRSGMGAIPYSGGTMFRVWAPNASSVSVAGNFNSWSATANPLASQGNGYWSVDVANVSAGALYKFVINGNMWRKDPYSRKQEHSTGASIVYQMGSRPTTINVPYFEDQIIYQLHVGSFGGSAPYNIGKFSDVVAKADYIKGLGVNMITMLPVQEFAGDNSWGYNTADYFAPESYYGGPEGLKNLVQAFHNRGIGVIMDIVYNHAGPSDIDLWRFDGWYQNDLGGIYFYNDWRAQTEWGHTRFDYGRGEVRQFLRDNAIYWLQEYSVDGLRWDSTINIRKAQYSSDIPEGWSLMQWINNEIKSVKPSAISIAEDLQNDAWITYPTSWGGAGFDSQWDATFVHSVKDNIETAWDSSRDMWAIRDALQVKYGERTRQLIYVTSHDEAGNGKQRPPSAIDPNNPGSWTARKRSTLGTAVLMTAPGIPMIFQGEEFLQPGWFDNSVHNNYLNWSLVTHHSGIVQLYKDLITLRKSYSALRSGNVNVFHVNNNNKVIAYHRWSGYQNMVVIANFGNTSYSNYEIGWPEWKTGYCVFNSDWNGYSSNFGNHGGWTAYPQSGGRDGMGQKASIAIAPYSVVVYDLY
jgi:1,4-alpha-glucan branching enzyme